MQFAYVRLFFLRGFYTGLSIDVQLITKTGNSSSNIIKLSALKLYSIMYHWRFSEKYSKPMYCLKKFEFAFFLVKYQVFSLSIFSLLFILLNAVCNTKVRNYNKVWILESVLFSNNRIQIPGARQKIKMFPEMWVTKKIFT